MSSSVLSPRDSGVLIASRSKHITLDDVAAKECARFMVDRNERGEMVPKKLFEETNVHPRVLK